MITLYVKTHLHTGLKYFGKTAVRDVFTYKGSGKRWTRHIAKHGYHVHTEIIGQYDEQADATTVALAFSEYHNIVESKEWANLIPENGLDGLPPGMVPFIMTPEIRQNLSRGGKRRWADVDKRAALISAQVAAWTPERREKSSEYAKGIWTEERRNTHSEKLKVMYAQDPSKLDEISNRFKAKVKTEAHKKKISLAHAGKVLSIETILKLRWGRIGGSVKHTNYADFARDCYTKYHVCLNYSTIAREFNTSVHAVISAVKFWPRLNDYISQKGNSYVSS